MNNKVTILTSLYRSEVFLDKFFIYTERILNKENFEFLLLHNDPTREELDIIKKHTTGKEYYKHIIIPQREGLYVTWNRGIDMSSGEYIGVWNVDDVRLSDSIFNQQQALDNHLEAGIAFGDIWGTLEHGENASVFHQHPSFEDAKSEYNERHMIGCFPMWRKKINGETYYFDEQFRLVADFDFQIRVAQIATIEKTEKPSGYYFDESTHKLSSNTDLQITELNVLNLRYANYHLLNLMYLIPAIQKYKIFGVKKGEMYTPVCEYFNPSCFYRVKRLFLFSIPIIKFPLHLACTLKRQLKKKKYD